MAVLYAAVAAALFALAVLPAQNSTHKERRAPGTMAARAGSAVPWRQDPDAALAEARRVGRPVFWYVPAVADSPMDRKPEVDRYLLGGPFSWPSTIELLATHFVPVRQVASGGGRAASLGLRRNQFIEPGYVVLDGDGRVLLKVDQLTTLHPQWFEAPLRRIARQPLERFPGQPVNEALWAAVRMAPAGAPDGPFPVPDSGDAAARAEAGWLLGVLHWRTGEHTAAAAAWRDLIERHPDSPWAWKAALELEGHGPFTRGFEVYGELPPVVLAADPRDGTRAPAGTYTAPELWARSVAFLLTAADAGAVWRDSTYDFGGTDSLPNVHAAITCLVGEALLAAVARAAAGALELSAAALARAEQQLLRVNANVMGDEWLALSDRDEILWARAYALRFLLAWQARRPGDAAAVAPGIRRAVDALIALQPRSGIWFHEYGNPFATATALQSLWQARAAGFEVPQANIDRGLRALAANRTKAGAFSYGATPAGRAPQATLPAAAGRMPLCELALYLFAASDEGRLRAAIEAGATHHGLLAAVRKYDDHADPHGNGGFFFWYDMLGRAEAIRALPAGATRTALAAAQRQLVIDLAEFDGCFVDSHELGRSYGTAMALLCLAALED